RGLAKGDPSSSPSAHPRREGTRRGVRGYEFSRLAGSVAPTGRRRPLVSSAVESVHAPLAQPLAQSRTQQDLWLRAKRGRTTGLKDRIWGHTRGGKRPHL